MSFLFVSGADADPFLPFAMDGRPRTGTAGGTPPSSGLTRDDLVITPPSAKAAANSSASAFDDGWKDFGLSFSRSLAAHPVGGASGSVTTYEQLFARQDNSFDSLAATPYAGVTPQMPAATAPPMSMPVPARRDGSGSDLDEPRSNPSASLSPTHPHPGPVVATDDDEDGEAANSDLLARGGNKSRTAKRRFTIDMTVATLVGCLNAKRRQIRATAGGAGAPKDAYHGPLDTMPVDVPCPAGFEVSVYNHDFAQHYNVPSEKVQITRGAMKYVEHHSRYGHQTRFRFQLCHNFLVSRCPKYSECNYIHATELPHSSQVHLNPFAPRRLALDRILGPDCGAASVASSVQDDPSIAEHYETLPPGFAIHVYPPLGNQISSVVTVAPSHMIIKTAGAVEALGMLADVTANATTVVDDFSAKLPRHCTKFQYRRSCPLGPACPAIHCKIPFAGTSLEARSKPCPTRAEREAQAAAQVVTPTDEQQQQQTLRVDTPVAVTVVNGRRVVPATDMTSTTAPAAAYAPRPTTPRLVRGPAPVGTVAPPTPPAAVGFGPVPAMAQPPQPQARPAVLQAPLSAGLTPPTLPAGAGAPPPYNAAPFSAALPPPPYSAATSAGGAFPVPSYPTAYSPSAAAQQAGAGAPPPYDHHIQRRQPVVVVYQPMPYPVHALGY
jgi:hypothetical protein